MTLTKVLLQSLGTEEKALDFGGAPWTAGAGRRPAHCALSALASRAARPVGDPPAASLSTVLHVVRSKTPSSCEPIHLLVVHGRDIHGDHIAPVRAARDN